MFSVTFRFLKERGGKGFTLIELLVVVAIIGLLSSVVLVTFRNMRASARDAHRIAEIDQFYKVLEVCYLAKGIYPKDVWDVTGTGWEYTFSCGSCYGSFEEALEECTKADLKDPINESPLAYYYFYFEPDATTYNGVQINNVCKGRYALMTHLELSKYEKIICFDEPDYYEYWAVLGLD